MIAAPHGRQRCVQAGVLIAVEIARLERRAIGVTGQPGHPTHRVNPRPIGNAVAPGTGLPERRHRHIDDVRIPLAQGFPFKTEVAHDPRRVVLQHDIRALDQIEECRSPCRSRQVQCDRALVDRQFVRTGVAVPRFVRSLTAIGLRSGRRSRSSPGSLDSQHLRAQRSQQDRGNRTSDSSRQVKNANPAKWTAW